MKELPLLGTVLVQRNLVWYSVTWIWFSVFFSLKSYFLNYIWLFYKKQKSTCLFPLITWGSISGLYWLMKEKPLGSKYRGWIIHFSLIMRVKLFCGIGAIKQSVEKPLFMFLESVCNLLPHPRAAVSRPRPPECWAEAWATTVFRMVFWVLLCRPGLPETWQPSCCYYTQLGVRP